MELNYFPIKFEFENFQIDKTPYSDDILKSLRKSYNATHSFFRNGDDIYVSNYNSEQQLDIKLTSDQKNIYTDYPVTASLIKHLFFRNFKDRFVSFTSVDFYPFRFFSSKDKDDLIYHLLPSELKGRIGYKKMIEVQMRLTNINGIKQFGFIVNIERNWIFDKNCAALHFEGYDLTGVEVLHTEIFPGSGNVLAPNEDYIGSILQTDGESAKVATNEGEKVYPLSELFIRKTKFNIGNYLDFATSSSKSTEILEHIENRRHEIYNTKSLYGEITEIAKALFSNKLDGSAVGFQNKDGFYFTVQDTPLQVSNTFELKTPTFIFDPAATKTNNVSPDLGLTNFGPYDSINFDIKSPNILGICHRENRGHFSNFLGSLKDGMSESRFFKKGLLKKYELQEVNYDINQLASFDIEEYFRIIREWDGDKKPDLAIIEIPFEFRKLKDEENPYYKLKAKLLSLEIPVQYISSDKVRVFNEYILNSIALQIYAKLGGTPWVLPAQRSVDREIIVGIGHSLVRKNLLKGASQSKIVGITTFLSSDGQYLLGEKVKDVEFDHYFNELLNSLTHSFNRLEKEQG